MILPLQPPKAHRGSDRLDSEGKCVPVPSLVKRHFMEERHRKPILSGKVNRGAGDWRRRGAGGYARRQHRDAAESTLSHQP